MSGTDNVDLPDLSHEPAPEMAGGALLNSDSPQEAAPKRSAADLEAVFDVPVTVSAVLGKSAMEVSQLLKLCFRRLIGKKVTLQCRMVFKAISSFLRICFQFRA